MHARAKTHRILLCAATIVRSVIYPKDVFYCKGQCHVLSAESHPPSTFTANIKTGKLIAYPLVMEHLVWLSGGPMRERSIKYLLVQYLVWAAHIFHHSRCTSAPLLNKDGSIQILICKQGFAVNCQTSNYSEL